MVAWMRKQESLYKKQETINKKQGENPLHFEYSFLCIALHCLSDLAIPTALGILTQLFCKNDSFSLILLFLYTEYGVRFAK